MLSLNISDFIGSIFAHVVRGYAEAVSVCLFIALTRAFVIRSLTPPCRKQRRFR